jgi:hypothetical protein
MEIPKKSKQTIEDEEIRALAKGMAFDPTLPQYIRTKALGTYSAMRQRMERLKAEKSAKSAALRAEKAKANPPKWNVPDNGRLVRVPDPATLRPRRSVFLAIRFRESGLPLSQNVSLGSRPRQCENFGSKPRDGHRAISMGYLGPTVSRCTRTPGNAWQSAKVALSWGRLPRKCYRTGQSRRSAVVDTLGDHEWLHLRRVAMVLGRKPA